jgi:metal-dependent amidase/aminoacylase/carboxypeptidase family protein
VNISKGMAMSMADSWKVTSHGWQARGAQPEQSIDPIVLGGHMVVRIQIVVSREVHPMKSAVVTIGTFHGGMKERHSGVSRVHAERAHLRPGSEERVLGSLRRIINAEVTASGAPEPTIEEITRFPECYGNPSSTEDLIVALARVLSDDAVIECPPMMGSVDFGLLADAIGVPSVYWFFGGYPQHRFDGETPGNHSPYFAPDIEPTLTTGVRSAITALLSKLGTAR